MGKERALIYNNATNALQKKHTHKQTNMRKGGWGWGNARGATRGHAMRKREKGLVWGWENVEAE